jgi:hypothetical protein
LPGVLPRLSSPSSLSFRAPLPATFP